MIRSFRRQGLKQLWETGRSAKVPDSLRARCVRRLDVIDRAVALADLNLPGYNLHRLYGKPVRYAIAVNGPWRLTFAWEEGDTLQLDLEQYR